MEAATAARDALARGASKYKIKIRDRTISYNEGKNKTRKTHGNFLSVPESPPIPLRVRTRSYNDVKTVHRKRALPRASSMLSIN